MWKSKNKGFLLLEVMLAVTILSVGLVMVARSYAASLCAVKVSQDLLVANLLLEEKIWQKQEEKLRTQTLIPDNEQGSFPSPFERFNYEINFEKQEDLPMEYQGSLYKSTFNVFWKHRKKEYNASPGTFIAGN